MKAAPDSQATPEVPYAGLEDAATALHRAYLLSEAVQSTFEALEQKLQGSADAGLLTAVGILSQQLLDNLATEWEAADLALDAARKGGAA